MESGGSLLHSQEPAICPYPEPAQSSIFNNLYSNKFLSKSNHMQFLFIRIFAFLNNVMPDAQGLFIHIYQQTVAYRITACTYKINFVTALSEHFTLKIPFQEKKKFMSASLNLQRLNTSHGITCDVCELQAQVQQLHLRGRSLELIMAKYVRYSVSCRDGDRAGGHRNRPLLLI
jgi:hypothetical protein